MAEIKIEKMAQIVAERAIQELRDNGIFVGRWIPVSERLPEDKQKVLVTTKNGNVQEILWNQWFQTQTQYPKIEVLAWMPLPEPYKENEDATN